MLLMIEIWRKMISNGCKCWWELKLMIMIVFGRWSSLSFTEIGRATKLLRYGRSVHCDRYRSKVRLPVLKYFLHLEHDKKSNKKNSKDFTHNDVWVIVRKEALRVDMWWKPAQKEVVWREKKFNGVMIRNFKGQTMRVIGKRMASPPETLIICRVHF